MTQLIKDAIGFDVARGDTVSVTAADFLAPPMPEPLPAQPMWQQPWVWDVGKQVLGALFVFFLVFAVLKPTMKSMLAKPAGVLGSPGNDLVPALPGAVPDGLDLPDGHGFEHSRPPGQAYPLSLRGRFGRG